MYRDELIALMVSVTEWWMMLDNADLANVTHAEDLAEKAQEVELMANELCSEFLGLAHFLEEVRQG